jgi:phenylacetate-CoA ligase
MNLIDSFRIASRLLSLNRSQWWSETRIRNYQEDAIVSVLRHAIENVPHYRTLGLDAKEISSVDDLQRFPILTKRDVQQGGDDLLADRFDKRNLRWSMTSGTSGEPTTTYYDDDSWLLGKFALKIRRMTGNGLGLFKRVVVISEQTREQLRRSDRLVGSSLLFDQQLLSIHDPVQSHLAVLCESGIDALYAFPSYLAELLDHCDASNIAPPQIPIVFTSSEVLQDTQRRRVEEKFGARVCDIYGSTEFKEIAWQCAYGTYHVNFESVYLETVPNSTTDGEDALITSLTNRAMPLIRYRIGDQCRLRMIECRCGRNGPSISSIGGRVVEMVRLPNGKRISPYLLTTAIEAHSEIAKYQILQSGQEGIEVRYVPKRAELSEADVYSIESVLRRHLGRAMAVRVMAVPVIPRTAAGKHRVFVQGMGA